MKHIEMDVVVVGGGPAGMAAALRARELGMQRVLVLERDTGLGGILQQCIHDGFGLYRFGKRLSGTQYAQVFIDDLERQDIEVKLDTMVLQVTAEKTVYACNKIDGLLEIKAGAVILTMGCRERTACQAFIYGERPAGILTAGLVQRYINIEGYIPGKKAVILGSGDIGLIMARRMTLEGMEVQAVYELMKSPGGLIRNIVQCLDDYGIPLHLSTTVTQVHGRKRVEAVTVAKVDDNLKPISGTEERIECDLLVLAVGLIPENELSRMAGVEIDARTKGPILDDTFMTNVPGIFAAGNVAVVFDLVDFVSQSGEIAAAGAAAYLAGKLPAVTEYASVTPAGNVDFVVPQRLRPDGGKTNFFMRVKAPEKKAVLQCISGGEVILQKPCNHVAPPEMLTFGLEHSGSDALIVSMGSADKEGSTV